MLVEYFKFTNFMHIYISHYCVITISLGLKAYCEELEIPNLQTWIVIMDCYIVEFI